MKFIPREKWGARPPKAVNPLPLLKTIVFHYTASNADEQADHRNCYSRVRGIQRFHMDGQGWFDIAYNYVVCKHGYVFEGRGFHKSGATGPANAYSAAICFLGDDTAGRDDLTANGRVGLADAARLIQEHEGKRLPFAGHRDYMSTSCPGDEIYRYVHTPGFRNLVQQDDKASLRKWILEQRAKGVGWKRIKETWQFKRFIKLGGK